MVIYFKKNKKRNEELNYRLGNFIKLILISTKHIVAYKQPLS